MPFTVARPGATRDLEFEVYVWLLRDRGVDLTRTPRTPEPGTGDRWLYVWDCREDAEQFAKDLRKRTRTLSWRVQEVADDCVSEGPLGPVTIDMHRQGNDCVYGLDPYSRRLIEEKYPGAPAVSRVLIGGESTKGWEAHFQERVWDKVALILTGLNQAQLDELGGYRIYETAKERVVRTSPLLAGRNVQWTKVGQ